ncbi:MAG: 4-alpha-glucanotransferase [Candidatus Omnitrophica bacterium]|nr:4-alpha-glucanotransferase [Candidatus Omnitrophota bacterium]
MENLDTSKFYQSFLSKKTGKQWKRIGIDRRSGVAAPLFSLWSKSSVGIGEFPDLKLLVDWCSLTGMSIIQLLPMNDVGFDFRPYDAQSTFALEPMYLSLENLSGIDIKPYQTKISALREHFPTGAGRVNNGIKKEKLNLLWQIFRGNRHRTPKSFEDFVETNAFWLENYVLFKAIKEKNDLTGWFTWEERLKRRDPEALKIFAAKNREIMKFHQWLQWQIYEQFSDVKKYAESRDVLLMGDLPFLVSRDSADVWSHQDYFKLELSSGAPPDMYFAKGQRWGMPPYHWEHIESDGFEYLVERLQFAENFYDLYRIDHVIGVFRLWTIPLSEPLENHGLNGCFDPSDEGVWEAHGRKLLSVMIENTKMLPCGEDLGIVPACSYRVLEDYGIPGMEVQRWMKDWGQSYDFKDVNSFRMNSISCVSTHDTSSLQGWWEYEAGTIDEVLFQRKCASRGISFETIKYLLFDLKKSGHGRLRWKKKIDAVSVLTEILDLPQDQMWEFSDLYLSSYSEKRKFWRYLGLPGEPHEECTGEFLTKTLEKVSQTVSIFCINLLQDWLLLEKLEKDAWNFRINFPGTLDPKNWTIAVPFSLEEIKQLAINDKIRLINQQAGRR